MSIEIANDFLLPYQIKKMVSMAGKLNMEQVLQMFREYDNRTVMYHVLHLAEIHHINLEEHRCKEDESKIDISGSFLTARIESKKSESSQRDLSDAFWVLSTIGNENILDYWLNTTPSETQLLFLTHKHKGKILHDVTVLSAWTEQAKRTADSWKRGKNSGIPKGMDDCIDHIALVFQESVGTYAVQKAGFNRCFSMTDHAFHPAIKGLKL